VTRGSRLHSPMHPDVVMLTSDTPVSSMTRMRALSTSRAPEAMPQVHVTVTLAAARPQRRAVWEWTFSLIFLRSSIFSFDISLTSFLQVEGFRWQGMRFMFWMTCFFPIPDTLDRYPRFLLIIIENRFHLLRLDPAVDVIVHDDDGRQAAGPQAADHVS